MYKQYTEIHCLPYVIKLNQKWPKNAELCSAFLWPILVKIVISSWWLNDIYRHTCEAEVCRGRGEGLRLEGSEGLELTSGDVVVVWLLRWRCWLLWFLQTVVVKVGSGWWWRCCSRSVDVINMGSQSWESRPCSHYTVSLGNQQTCRQQCWKYYSWIILSLALPSS